MKLEIIEAEWNGNPTYLIGIRIDGEIWPALWKIDGIEGTPDAKPIWTDRVSWAWHTPDRKRAEEVLTLIERTQP